MTIYHLMMTAMLSHSKVCFKCKEHLPLDAFYKHKRMADGHLNKCKACSRKDSIFNREANLEYYREYDRNRANLPHRVLQRKEYALTDNARAISKTSKKKWIDLNEDKRGAHVVVNNALRDGRIEKPKNCEVCGKSDCRLEAHHEDYSKTLDVVWLCVSCHAKLHKDKRSRDRLL